MCAMMMLQVGTFSGVTVCKCMSLHLFWFFFSMTMAFHKNSSTQSTPGHILIKRHRTCTQNNHHNVEVQSDAPLAMYNDDDCNDDANGDYNNIVIKGQSDEVPHNIRNTYIAFVLLCMTGPRLKASSCRIVAYKLRHSSTIKHRSSALAVCIHTLSTVHNPLNLNVKCRPMHLDGYNYTAPAPFNSYTNMQPLSTAASNPLK